MKNDVEVEDRVDSTNDKVYSLEEEIQAIAEAVKSGAISKSTAAWLRRKINAPKSMYTRKQMTNEQRKAKRKAQRKARKITRQHGYKGQKIA